VSWPASGETDIMENIGYPDWTSSSLHGPGYSADGTPTPSNGPRRPCASTSTTS
jgi:hypothetical protein